MATPRVWYLLAYDIRDPRRLRRVHRYLRRRALAAQESVFFLHVTDAELRQVLDGVAARIDRRRDDVRAYPITHPAEVWLAGQSPVAGALLRPSAVGASAPPPGVLARVARWWRTSRE